jgi:type II secretory ATPase GspE/PulE/Tfp pilus assembly ATPase PilB-like protein
MSKAGRIIPECEGDTVLVEMLGYKRPNHQYGIHEVLKMTSTLKELIIKGASSDEIEKQAKKEGMMSMIEDGLFKAVQGMTTVEEVLRVISE